MESPTRFYVLIYRWGNGDSVDTSVTMYRTIETLYASLQIMWTNLQNSGSTRYSSKETLRDPLPPQEKILKFFSKHPDSTILLGETRRMIGMEKEYACEILLAHKYAVD